MRPCCSQATASAIALHASAPSAQIERAPDAIADHDAVARRAIERRRQLALHVEERQEDVANRLTETFRRVLHARVEPREATIPGRAAPHAAVIEDAAPAATVMTIVATMASRNTSGA